MVMSSYISNSQTDRRIPTTTTSATTAVVHNNSSSGFSSKNIQKSILHTVAALLTKFLTKSMSSIPSILITPPITAATTTSLQLHSFSTSLIIPATTNHIITKGPYNHTLALLFPPGLLGGYRNQVIH
jgi:fructose-specific phosphotransferase system IIC component